MLRIKPNPTTALSAEAPSQVPLKSVQVDAKLRSFAADVVITQVFRNDEKQPIEAVYCFPIEERAAVYSFVARIGEREIVAQLKEKKEAQAEYSTALQQGHGAYLLEQDENSQDNFIVNVGALPPSEECTIIISYVTELEFVQGSNIRFVVPTTIAPRYNPGKGGVGSPAGTSSKYVQSSPYSIDLRCQIDKMGRSADEYIARINSPSHPIQVDFAQAAFYLVTLSQANTHLDRDILINIELSSKRTNSIAAVEPGAVMAVFTPTEEDCRHGSKDEQTNEFLFVVDCSGSMQDENKIGLARQAMLLFLKSLPVDCYFNVIRFGSTHKNLFPEVTAIYNESNARKAEQLINEMKADLGGTELLRPLRWIQENPPSQSRARQIFLLTDGEISDVTEVLDLCRSMATSTRIFSFGLGQSPSRSLVKGLARSTNGRFVFIPPSSKVDIYVGEQLEKALQPCLTQVRVQWNLGVPLQCAPTELPPIYVNDRLIVYAVINDKTSPFSHNSSVELKSEVDQRTLSVAKVDAIPNVFENQTIARLAAKALILELQHAKTPSSTISGTSTGSTQTRFQNLVTANEEAVKETPDERTSKQRIIDLSLKYNILSPHTAFVGIEKRTNGNNAQMVLREVPIEISADDKHLNQRSIMSSMTSSRNCVMPMGAAFGGGGRGGRGMAPRMMNMSSRQTSDASFDFLRHKMSGRSKATANMAQPLLESRSRSRNQSKHIDVEADSDEDCLNREVSDGSGASEGDKTWPMNDEDIVRHLIEKQNFDGLWQADSKIIEKLTGKPLASFQSTNSNVESKVLASMIIVHILETRYAAFSSLWHGIVQKARKRISAVLGNDSKTFDQVQDDIRRQVL